MSDVDAAVDALLEQVLQGAEPDLDALLHERPALGAPEREHVRRLFDALSAHPPRAAEASELGPQLDDYRILRRLGEGGMGVVYLAEELALHRLVALKVLRPELTGSERAVERLRREALAIARLRHPHIVTVLAAGSREGTHYLAMEWVPGASLQELLARPDHGLPLPVLLRWGIEIAQALEAAHDAGVVHRDVKPANVRITPEGRALLVDFGLAVTPDTTRSLGFRGTPHYASPEQVGGDEEPDGRSDVYSLGVLLYEAITGRVPFDGPSPERVFHRILSDEPVPLRRLVPGLPRDLETVVLKAMEKDRRDRYPSAAALAADLEAVLALRAVSVRGRSALQRLVRRARRNPLAVLGVLGLAVGALLAASAPLWLALQTGAEFERSLARARAGLEELREVRARRSELKREVGPLRAALTTRPLGAVEREQLFAGERSERALALEADAQRAAVLEALRRAELLDREAAERSGLHARTYLELWRDARAARDPLGEGLFRGLVESNDPQGRLADELDPTGTLELTTEPSGAEVHLFRYEEHAAVVPEGEPRLVPVPLRGAPPGCPPGARVLRLARDAPPLRAGDLLLEIEGFPAADSLFVLPRGPDAGPLERLVSVDGREVRELFDVAGHPLAPQEDGKPRLFRFEGGAGPREVQAASLARAGLAVADAVELGRRGALHGARARVFRAGATEERELSGELELRRTAAPLWVSDGSLAGTTPLPRLELPEGGYLALLRAPDHAEVRLPFVVRGGQSTRLAPRLLERAAVPPGYVFVPSGRLLAQPLGAAPVGIEEREVPGFLLMEREVTFREYLEFLNTPEIQAEVEDEHGRSGRWIRVPRDLQGLLIPGLSRDSRGWHLPASWLDVPASSIASDDAQAFALWTTERTAARGTRLEFFLPSAQQLQWAARGADGREFVHGSRFVPAWIKSRLARDVPEIEPVLSFPLDESPFGLFDLGGSVSEWTSDSAANGWVSCWGGSWSRKMPYDFSLAARQEYPPEITAAAIGFRLAARPEP